MIGRWLKRILPGFVVLLGTLVGIAFAARRERKELEKAEDHETEALRLKRNNRLREADRQTQKSNDARKRAANVRKITERRMKEAGDREPNFAAAARRYNERVRDLREGAESVPGGGTGTGL